MFIFWHNTKHSERKKSKNYFFPSHAHTILCVTHFKCLITIFQTKVCMLGAFNYKYIITATGCQKCLNKYKHHLHSLVFTNAPRQTLFFSLCLRYLPSTNCTMEECRRRVKQTKKRRPKIFDLHRTKNRCCCCF